MDKPSSELPLEQLEVIDRLANEFERRLRNGEQPRIEDFLQQHPHLRAALLRALLPIEMEMRQAAGDLGVAEEYQARFPGDADIVSDVRSLVSATTSAHNLESAGQDDEQPPKHLGRYQIRSRLGRGGFGVVYLANDPELDRPVAIKVPRQKRFRTAEQVTNFVQEARTAARLKHPLLVTVHDVQQHDGLPYIVQEFIDGQNLGDWAATHHPSFEQIVRVMAGVVEALAYVHQQGLTHCDLKLANVLMDMAGQPHVADFGLAVHDTAQALRKDEIFGTPAMMSPEQVRGESHRLDGRTDIWAIGVMLYQLLVGRRPFRAESTRELFTEIQAHDPKPPRQIDRSVPRELERICLKCLAKRRSERYNTMDDLREDLLTWLKDEPSTLAPQSTAAVAVSVPDSSSASKPPFRIIPKGLRSFGADDRGFFLELLPGPRDRDGLPESIRFWKQRIEQFDSDDTFSVGLIYGPSGCGKSSLVKAGLLPFLGQNVLPIYVEATAGDTEGRILKQLRKHIPRLPTDCSLPEACAELRLTGAGRDCKILLVIDQFEQWLHSHHELRNCQLVDALRHCEGGRLQSVLLVRDDFFASVHRLFQELDLPLIDGHNYALVDRFDKDHARKVLAAFGRAFNKLTDDLSPDHEEFLTRAVDGLAEEGKIISVRLALFAEMLKGCPWVTASLQEVGGVGGVGVAFLNETFDAKTAPPSHRVHQQAIRSVLTALLPEAGSDIKGAMRSTGQLCRVSGYQGEGRKFDELMQILDSELRLITPTDPEGPPSEPGSDLTTKYYQLTHDYLVPSLREWLTRKQKVTRRGRAELRLAELSAAWNGKPENRHLPNLFEWLNTRLLTDKKAWSVSERKMMSKAAWLHGLRTGSVLAGILVIGLLAQQYAARLRRQTTAMDTSARVDTLRLATGPAIPLLFETLDRLPRPLVQQELRSRFNAATRQHKLSLAYGLARYDQVDVDAVIAGIADFDTSGVEVANIIAALAKAKEEAIGKLRAAAATASMEQNWQIKARLSVVAMYLGDTSLVAEMLRGTSDVSPPQEPEDPRAKQNRRLAEIENVPSEKQSNPDIKDNSNQNPLNDDPEIVDPSFHVAPATVLWNPVQRTLFIAEFPHWCGEIGQLADILRETKNADIRSGISLAIGSFDRLEPSVKENWGRVFAQWYTELHDSGTHSAAGWALRQWGQALPALKPTERSAGIRNWWLTPLDLIMLQMPPGQVATQSGPPIVIFEPFWLSDREISIGLFKQFMADEQAERPDDWEGAYTFDGKVDASHPVQQVSWEDAVMFCNWLSDRHGLKRCYTIERLDDDDQSLRMLEKYRVEFIEESNGFRLPIADEWEYACRAGTTTVYTCGDDARPLSSYAVFGQRQTEPCGSRLCNAWGLFDMHGNVWEWCWDAAMSGREVARVDHGGSWLDGAALCESSYRGTIQPNFRNSTLGFRVACGPRSSSPGIGANR